MAGKSLFTTDTLSRAPCSYSVSESGGNFTDQELDTFADAITDAIPIVQSMLIKVRTAQIDDSVCSRIKQYSCSGWPSKKYIPGELKPYLFVRDELSVCNDLLLYGKHIITPRSLQTFTFKRYNPVTWEYNIVILEQEMWYGGQVWPSTFCQWCRTVTFAIRRIPWLLNHAMISLELPAYPWQRVYSHLFEMATALMCDDKLFKIPLHFCLESHACSTCRAKLCRAKHW